MFHLVFSAVALKPYYLVGTYHVHISWTFSMLGVVAFSLFVKAVIFQKRRQASSRQRVSARPLNLVFSIVSSFQCQSVGYAVQRPPRGLIPSRVAVQLPVYRIIRPLCRGRYAKNIILHSDIVLAIISYLMPETVKPFLMFQKSVG